MIDGLVRQMVRHALEQASAVLTRRRAALERAAQMLLTRETLTSVELAEIVGEDHGS